MILSEKLSPCLNFNYSNTSLLLHFVDKIIIFFFPNLGEKKSEYSEYMRENFPSKSYQDLAPELTGKNFDPDQWASLVVDSGAR